ncbi:protein disulfide oxidoreductase DsbA, partial [Citrobacter freundii]
MTYSLADDLFIKCYLEYMEMKKYLLPLIGLLFT